MPTQPVTEHAAAAPERPHWAQRHPRDAERGAEGPAPRVVAPSPFRLVSGYKPAGDQPQAIGELVGGLAEGERDQVLLGGAGPGGRTGHRRQTRIGYAQQELQIRGTSWVRVSHYL